LAKEAATFTSSTLSLARSMVTRFRCFWMRPASRPYSGFVARTFPLESRDLFRHEHIEFMEVDVGQDWRDDTALRSAAVGPGVNPVFHNTRLKHAADQADEFLVIDPFRNSRRRMSWSMFSKNPATSTSTSHFTPSIRL
jgi:hypothetical protein